MKPLAYFMRNRGDAETKNPINYGEIAPKLGVELGLTRTSFPLSKISRLFSNRNEWSKAGAIHLWHCPDSR